MHMFYNLCLIVNAKMVLENLKIYSNGEMRW